MTNRRILIATDVPFWRKSTGAQQRIASLVDYLTSQSFDVQTFYLGQTNSQQYTQSDRELIETFNLDVQQKSSDQPPQGLAKKIGWYTDATLNQIKQFRNSATGTENSQAESNSSSQPPVEPPTLEDYRWPWAIKAFAESISTYKPDFILIEYIKLAYLLDALSDSQKVNIKTIVDTHDVLHLRANQFRESGFSHWIELSHEEESNQLKKFDSILAIQPTEANIIRQMAPDCETIVCGHATFSNSDSNSSRLTDDSARDLSQPLRIGYLASTNAANAIAIEDFIENVWPNLPASDFELVVAGQICNWLTENAKKLDGKLAKVKLIGMIDELSTFYDQVDVVINPVKFGSGLKIKNCEALAFGKPVLTTEHGFDGMPLESKSAVSICETPAEFETRLTEIQSQENILPQLQRAARELSQTAFSPEQAYSSLKRLLESKK